MPILMNGDGIGFWVVGGGWRGSPCGWSSPRTESSGQSTWRTAPEAGEIPLPHSRPSSATPRFPCRFLLPGAYFRHAARRTETNGALAYRHPRLREYPVLPASCLPDCRFQLFSLTADFFLPAPGLAPPRPPVLLDFVGIFSPLFRKISSPPAGCL